MDIKRTAALLIAAAAALSVMTSCGGKNDTSSKGNSNSSEAAVSAADDKGSADDNGAAAQALARSGEVRDIPAADIVAEMSAGWNLGNSLDVFDGNDLGSETKWGNPKTTKEMIDGVQAQGFDLIRIPVTWGNHVDESYTIDPEWLDRVQEVVNYAYDDGMYVIINSHHEESWRITDNEHIEEVDKEHAEIWRQIAERFKDYGDHLVFEGLNEPRVKGSVEEWTGGDEDGRECVARLNRTFRDTVRATGGNNENRLLLYTTYASSCALKAIKDAEIPEDKHIGYSIHAYTPYAFTYSPGEDWALFTWDGSHEGEILSMMYELKEKFVDSGVPVIITEYGAVNKDGNDEEVAKWAKFYVETAKQMGIPCVWWDNGCYFSGNELFGIYDRSNCKWFSPSVADAVIKASEK